MKKHLIRGFILIVTCAQLSCSLFFGSVKPIDDKSSAYLIFDLSKLTEWTRLDSKKDKLQPGESSYNAEDGGSDLAFQSQQTGAVISLNSVCRNLISPPNKTDLRKLTRELLLGISNIHSNTEVETKIDGQPALETTLLGKMNEKNVAIRAVVLNAGDCTYDLMYVTQPDRFSIDEGDFTRFATSLHIK